mmetsp:Transcript_14844/g.56168  ORF Transcript_14844/g.56168 Transcript_14844/m.56168 type:complete len:503 (+) Transcript_14844:3569-5077(+)
MGSVVDQGRLLILVLTHPGFLPVPFHDVPVKGRLRPLNQLRQRHVIRLLRRRKSDALRREAQPRPSVLYLKQLLPGGTRCPTFENDQWLGSRQLPRRRRALVIPDTGVEELPAGCILQKAIHRLPDGRLQQGKRLGGAGLVRLAELCQLQAPVLGADPSVHVVRSFVGRHVDESGFPVALEVGLDLRRDELEAIAGDVEVLPHRFEILEDVLILGVFKEIVARADLVPRLPDLIVHEQLSRPLFDEGVQEADNRAGGRVLEFPVLPDVDGDVLAGGQRERRAESAVPRIQAMEPSLERHRLDFFAIVKVRDQVGVEIHQDANGAADIYAKGVRPGDRLPVPVRHGFSVGARVDRPARLCRADGSHAFAKVVKFLERSLVSLYQSDHHAVFLFVRVLSIFLLHPIDGLLRPDIALKVNTARVAREVQLHGRVLVRLVREEGEEVGLRVVAELSRRLWQRASRHSVRLDDIQVVLPVHHYELVAPIVVGAVRDEASVELPGWNQ